MTATGQYVSLTNAKLRLLQAGTTDTTNDPLISEIVADVNQYIETKTGRVIAPIPTFDSTFSGTAGSPVITIASAQGLAVGDDLLLGLVSGTHEDARVLQIGGVLTEPAWAATTAYSTGDIVQPTTPNGHSYRVVSGSGTSGSSQPSFHTNGTVVTDGTLTWLDQGAVGSPSVTLDVDLVHSYAGAVCQRIYVHNGSDALEFGRTLMVLRGVFALAALENTTFTGGPFSVVPKRDYFLAQSFEGMPDWPSFDIRMTNIPTPGNSTPVFFPGFRTVRLIGPGPCVGMTSTPGFGWPQYMDDLRDVATKLFMATFRERASSGGETFTVNLDGSRVYERALSSADLYVLERYRAKSVYTVEAGLVG